MLFEVEVSDPFMFSLSGHRIRDRIHQLIETHGPKSPMECVVLLPEENGSEVRYYFWEMVKSSEYAVDEEYRIHLSDDDSEL